MGIEMTKIEIGKSGFMPCQHINAVSEAGKKSDVDKKHYPSANQG